MIFSFEQLNIVHEKMRACEDSIFEATGIKVKLRSFSAQLRGRTPEQMMEVIAHSLQMEIGDYKVRSKKQNFVDLRFLATLFLRQYFNGISFGAIGELFGGQDHSTVKNAEDQAQAYIITEDLHFTTKYHIVKNAVEEWLEGG